MGIKYEIHPAIVFASSMGVSIVIFLALRLLLNSLYATSLIRSSRFQQWVQKIRMRGLPLITKFGLIGLIAFVAIPLPGTGVCPATVLSWLLGIRWQISLMAVLPGAAISSAILALLAAGIMHGINLLVG